uniref:Uncharacterized protein n=1 Tax=uncultured marine virus TaxID=186617 RepID=A0A0F7LAB6_9VIRU|nr:hypothetical protein [uncultured marine virus]
MGETPVDARPDPRPDLRITLGVECRRHSVWRSGSVGRELDTDRRRWSGVTGVARDRSRRELAGERSRLCLGGR